LDDKNKAFNPESEKNDLFFGLPGSKERILLLCGNLVYLLLGLANLLLILIKKLSNKKIGESVNICTRFHNRPQREDKYKLSREC
jgi:hypothetical protein